MDTNWHTNRFKNGPVNGQLETFTVEILTNPPMYEIALGISKVERKTIQIKGISLEDAKRRAGIQ